MAVYLGKNKVGVAIAASAAEEAGGGLTDEQMEQLTAAVNWRTSQHKESYTIDEVVDDLNNDYGMTQKIQIMPNYKSTWTRPAAWPDLDSLNLQMSGDDFIYMTYDNTQEKCAFAWHIEKVSGGKDIKVEVGYVYYGMYLPRTTITGTSNNYIYWLDNATDGDYPVFRITGDIRTCYGTTATANEVTQYFHHQPLVERIAWVPHLVNFGSSYTSQAGAMYTLQRDKVANGTGTALTSLYYAWAYCRHLQDLDISGLNTPNVTNLSRTFLQCRSLPELDLKHWSVSKVTNMGYLFDSCYNLKTIDLTSWSTNAVTDITYLFNACYSLTNIPGIETFNVAKITSLANTFSNCRSLLKLDLHQWRPTAKLTTLASTFNNCYALKKLDLAGWDVSGVTTCSGTFNACSSLKILNTENWHTGALTTIASIFNSCNALEKIDLTPYNITSACTSIYSAFSNCWSVQELNFPEWDVSGISNSNNTATSVFASCYSLRKITGIKDWKFQFTNSLASMFSACYSLEEVDVSGWTVHKATSLASCFQNCRSLKTLDLSNWNPENCSTFANMFNGCQSLTSVGDISGWSTSACTTFASMFNSCHSLTEFPKIQTWSYSVLTTMENMFNGCYSLEEIDWQNVNLPRCTNINNLFRYCYHLKKANTTGWIFGASVTYNSSNYMLFGDCTILHDVEGPIIVPTYTQIGYNNCEELTRESILKIFEALPSTTAGHTIHVPTQVTNLLTTEEKAIATNKNWTIAT